MISTHSCLNSVAWNDVVLHINIGGTSSDANRMKRMFYTALTITGHVDARKTAVAKIPSMVRLSIL